MNSLIQLDIPKRSAHCFHKGEKFVSGMEIYSLLLEEEDHHFGRQDFCSACWNHMQKEGLAKDRSYWRSFIESKKESKESARTARALTLLREFLLQVDTREGEIYVLSLFLSHARQITLRQEFIRDGIRFQLYEVLRQEEFITIKTVQLTELQIHEIQKTLAEKL